MSNKVEIRRMRSQLRTWGLEDEVGFPYSTAFFYEDKDPETVGIFLATVVHQRKQTVVAVMALLLISVFFAAVVLVIITVGIPIVVGPLLISGMAAVSITAKAYAHGLSIKRDEELQALSIKIDEIRHRQALVNEMAQNTRLTITGVPQVQDVKYRAPLQRRRALSSYPDTPEGRAAAVEQAKEIQYHQQMKDLLDSAARRTAGLDTINNQRKES